MELMIVKNNQIILFFKSPLSNKSLFPLNSGVDQHSQVIPQSEEFTTGFSVLKISST